MPNHLTTVCRVTGPEPAIASFRAKCIVPVVNEHALADAPKERFDLSTVIPRPACVDATTSGSEADAGFFALTGLNHVAFARFNSNPMERYAASPGGFPIGPMSTPTGDFREWLAEKHPSAIAAGEASLRCFRETGYRDWYEWSYACWGTKWNSYDYEERSNEPAAFVFKFETANGFPGPVFRELAKLFPSLTFDIDTIDEGGPEFVGHFSAAGCTFAGAPESDERYRLCYGREREVSE